MSPAAPRDPGRRRGSCLLKLLALLTVLGAATALGWMLLLPVVVVAQLRERTGFDATVETLSCNVFSGRIAVRGLVVKNPASFPIGDFVDLRAFSAEADVGALFSDRLVFDVLTVDVRKVTLVRRADGKSNAELLQASLFGAPAAAVPTSGAASTPDARPARSFLIRRLSLRFDHLVIADHSGGKTTVQEFPLGLDQRYENVTDTQQLLVPDVLRQVGAVNLGPLLSQLIPGNFGQTLGKAAREAKARGEDLLKDAGQTATDFFKGLREKLEESKKP